MLKKLFFLSLVLFNFCIQSSENKVKAGVRNVKIYFEDREQARSFERIIDKEEELQFDKETNSTDNGGYFVSIDWLSIKEFNLLQKLFYTNCNGIMTFNKNNKYLCLQNLNLKN